MAKKKATQNSVQGALQLPGAVQVVPEETRQELALFTNAGLSELFSVFGAAPFGGSQLSQTDTLFKNNRWYLVSNMRQLLSELYVEHGLIQTICNVPVDDALRGGVDFKTNQLSEDDILQIVNDMEEADDLGIIGQAAKWNRLFGGGAVLIMTAQDPSTPLNEAAITMDTPLELRDCDLWELYSDKMQTDVNNMDVSLQPEFYNYYGIKVHKSRVRIMKGLKAPSFIRPRLRGWGFSIVEALVRSINQYLKSNNLAFEVLDEFKVDVFRMKGLYQTLLAADGGNKVRQRVQTANGQKSYLNALLLDKEDEYEQKQLTFAGLAEVMKEIRMQVASDLRMPLTKIFGISATGFNSGEDDIENYNAMVESDVRGKLKYDIISAFKLRCQRRFQMQPTDLSMAFKSLRIMSSKEEEEVKTQQFNRLHSARQSGEITSQEFRESCNKANLLPVKVDEELDLSMEQGGDADDDGETPEDVVKTGDKPTGRTKAKQPEEPKAARDVTNAADDVAQIATVGIIAGDEILTGKRRDNGLWTFPGGHMDLNESPTAAACREAFEESGIYVSVSQLEPLQPMRFTSHRAAGKQFVVYPFLARLDKAKATAKHDPDQEISEWKWVKIHPDTPELRPENRHAKRDLILEHLLK